MKTCSKSLLAAGFALLGCSSTGVGNPGVAMQSLSVSSDSEAEPDASDAAEQLEPTNLRHAMLVFGEVRYLACDTSEEDGVVDGPVVVDLATNHVQPEISAVAIPQSGFCGIDATLAPATSPPAMAGRSMFFSGLRSDGTLFLLFADMPGVLRMRPLDGVSWPSDGEHRWLWKLRPRRWLAPTELEAADTAELDGIGRVIAIDVNRHPVLYEAIRTRVARRSSLYLDLNDNDKLDAEERLDGALIGQGLTSID
jgi:hypothetical protein